MTPAEQALANTITFEAKKDSLRQSQSGDWKIAFTVQGVDMDTRLSKAAPGTRYIAVLVEINEQELPVSQAEKEVVPNNPASRRTTAQPQPAPTAGAKRPWRDLPKSQQAGICVGEAEFSAYLREEHPVEWRETGEPDACLKFMCGGITSKSELVTNHKAGSLWFQIDKAYQAWKARERVGA